MTRERVRIIQQCTKVFSWHGEFLLVWLLYSLGFFDNEILFENYRALSYCCWNTRIISHTDHSTEWQSSHGYSTYISLYHSCQRHFTEYRVWRTLFSISQRASTSDKSGASSHCGFSHEGYMSIYISGVSLYKRRERYRKWNFRSFKVPCLTRKIRWSTKK